MRGSSHLVLILMNDRADVDGVARLSLREMAYGTGLDPMTVIRAVKDLIASGHIARLGQAAHHAPTSYRVLRPPRIIVHKAA